MPPTSWHIVRAPSIHVLPTTIHQLGATRGLMPPCMFGALAGVGMILGGCSATEAPDPGRVPILSPGIVERTETVDRLDPKLLGTPAGTVQSAQYLVDHHSDAYREKSPWLNLDPHHPLPTEVSLTGMAGKSKCNLFVLQTVYLGGWEPPRYGNGETGEYVNANQMWKWGDASAVRFDNPVRFETVAEAPLDGYSRPEKIDRITNVLRHARPGDLLLVDHGPGAGGERVVNRGHARVVLANPIAAGGNVIEIAHATDLRGAVVERETPSELTREHHIWILRPAAPRLVTATPSED